MFVCNRLGRWQFHAQRINLHTVFPKPVTNVWACCQAGASHITNPLSLPNANTRFDARCNFRHVKVLRSVCSVVADFYIVAVVRFILCFQHNTITNRTNGCTGRGSKIGTQVCLVYLLYRVQPALTIARTDAGKLNRIFQQCLSQAHALLIKIIQSVTLTERNSVITAAEVIEINSAYLLYANKFSVNLLLFVNEFKLIALLQALKVNLPGKNIHKLVC